MLVYTLVGLALIAACQAAPPEAAPPRLDWQPCADEQALQCATVVVPRDHAQPSGVTLTLSLVRVPAREPEQRTGSLVLNRGGPGYSTVEYVKLVWAGRLPNPLAPEVWARYDVIGVDQRGVGQSTPAIRCFASQAEEREFSAGLPPFPTTADEQRARAAKDLEYAQRCRELSGDLLDHVTTADAARDLDLIRAALGEERLNYLGQSYGTYLGAVYAHLFPDRVGRFVFDSVIDPERHTSGEDGTVVSMREGSDVASEAALAEFFRLCAEATDRCGFGAGDPAAAFERLIERLRTAPVRLTAQDGQVVDLDENRILDLVGSFLYQPAIWEAIALTLQQTEQVLAEPGGELATMYATAVLTLQAEGLGLAPYGSISPPFYAVTCTDTDHPRETSAWPEALEDRRAVSPHFAALRAYETSACAAWQGTGETRYTGPWGTTTDIPVLIVSSRFDPATPLTSAMRLHTLFSNSGLLVNDGWGHIATQQSSCIVAAISAYLVEARLPDRDATCTPDRIPFM